MKINQKIWEKFIDWVDHNVPQIFIKDYGFKQTTELFNEWKKNNYNPKTKNKDEIINETIINDLYLKEDLNKLKTLFELEPEYEYELENELENEYEEEPNEYDLDMDEDMDESDLIEKYNKYDEENELNDEEIQKYLEFERILFSKAKNKRPKNKTKYQNNNDNDNDYDIEDDSEIIDFKFNPNQKVESIFKTKQNNEIIKEIFKYAKKDFLNANNKKKFIGENNYSHNYNGELDKYLILSYQYKIDEDKIKTLIVYYLPPENKMDKSAEQIQKEIQKLTAFIEDKSSKDLEIYKNVDIEHSKFQSVFVNIIFNNTLEELKKAGYRIMQIEEMYS